MIAVQAWLRPAGTKGFRSKASKEGKGNKDAERKGKGEKKERGIAILSLLGMATRHKGKELINRICLLRRLTPHCCSLGRH